MHVSLSSHGLVQCLTLSEFFRIVDQRLGSGNELPTKDTSEYLGKNVRRCIFYSMEMHFRSCVSVSTMC